MALAPPALDLACDSGPITCSGQCGDLPVWTSGDFDALIALGPLDYEVLEACKLKLRTCQLCLDRGRKAGVVQ